MVIHILYSSSYYPFQQSAFIELIVCVCLWFSFLFHSPSLHLYESSHFSWCFFLCSICHPYTAKLYLQFMHPTRDKNEITNSNAALIMTIFWELAHICCYETKKTLYKNTVHILYDSHKFVSIHPSTSFLCIQATFQQINSICPASQNPFH